MTDHTQDTRGAMTDEQKSRLKDELTTLLTPLDGGYLMDRAPNNVTDGIAEIFARLAAPSLPAGDGLSEVRAALVAARQFIKNGAALGYIRMPDADCPDPAHNTLRAIEAAISILAAPRQPGEVGAGVQSPEALSQRLIDAIEGECDGLAITREQAGSILAYLQYGLKLGDAERYAARYEYLRDRPLDAISRGGVFAGMTPNNLVLNGEDLDREIDAAMAKDDADIEVSRNTWPWNRAASTQQSGYRCADCKAPLRLGYTCDVCDSDAAEDVETASAPQDEREADEISEAEARGGADTYEAQVSRLRRALRPFADIATPPLSWAMVEHCIKDDPEKQTLQRPQMQRAFNRAAQVYADTVARPVQYAKTPEAPYAPLQVQADAGAVLVSRADLEAINAAMQHLGDVLNGMDAVEDEDEEKTGPGFEAISRILAAHPSPAAESDKRDAPEDVVALSIIRCATAVVKHWNEFGPEHDFERAMHRLDASLEARAAMSREQSGGGE